MMPKVDILIPIRNSARFLLETIESVKNQSLTDWKIIFVDDASTDESIQIIQESLPRHKYSIVTNDEQKGVATSLNTAISCSSAPFLCRLDSDDLMHSNRLIIQIEDFEKNTEVNAIASNYNYIDINGKKLLTRDFPTISHNSVNRALVFGNPICHPSVMFRRTFDFKINYEIDQQEDYLTWVTNRHNFVWKIDSRRLVSWRLHPLNASKAIKVASDEMKQSHLALCNDLGIAISNDLQKSILNASSDLKREDYSEIMRILESLENSDGDIAEKKYIRIMISQFFMRKARHMRNPQAFSYLLRGSILDFKSSLYSINRFLGLKK